ncbi:nucleotide sugar dehydrogenase [Acidobacteriota bacterium]
MYKPNLKKVFGRKASISIVGLGYVGLPLAIEMGKVFNVIGYDISKARVDELRAGVDSTSEISAEELEKTKVEFTDDERRLVDALFHIVAVPTPIDRNKRPDLFPLIRASEIVGRNLTRGSIVVYESTVYPGVTEDLCASVLERESGMRWREDFKVGYSPERINPGDKEHTLSSIVKVVSGEDEETLDIIASVYEAVIKAGVHRAPNIRTAEAAKVIENTQRDLNIALMNELSIIFDKMGIRTHDVLEAARSKWNFLPFTPGLVGGHCIGVDPYYLTFKAQELGYHPQVILAGRSINDNMGKYIAEQIVKQLIKCGKMVQNSRLLILGLSFKENVSDIRNSRVPDIVKELQEYDIRVLVHDPLVDPAEAKNEYNIELVDLEDCRGMEGIILAVSHDSFKSMTVEKILRISNGRPFVVDVKNFFDREELESAGIKYWSL